MRSRRYGRYPPDVNTGDTEHADPRDCAGGREPERQGHPAFRFLSSYAGDCLATSEFAACRYWSPERFRETRARVKNPASSPTATASTTVSANASSFDNVTAATVTPTATQTGTNHLLRVFITERSSMHPGRRRRKGRSAGAGRGAGP